MILAGDIGATRTRMAAFQAEANKLELVVDKTYKSQEHGGLQEIISAFVKTEGIPVHRACFGVAGPAALIFCDLVNRSVRFKAQEAREGMSQEGHRIQGWIQDRRGTRSSSKIVQFRA